MKLLFVALVIGGYLGKSTTNSLADETQPENELWNSVPLKSRQWKITLLVFSELPDPEWVVHSSNRQIYEKIGKLFSNAVKAKEIYDPERMPSKLGYKGFLLQAGKEGPRFLILGDKTKKLQNVLLRSIPKRLISNDLKVVISKEIKKGRILPAETIVDLELQNDGQISKRQLPPNPFNIRLLMWNNPITRDRNNCYNYAVGKLTNSFAQPGRYSGIELPRQLRAQNVVDAAIADGLQLLSEEPLPGAAALAAIELNSDQHLVALTFFERDCHWFRQDRNEKWSHKPGRCKVSFLDKSNKIITDPRTADMYPYVFHCFMIVDSNRVAIR